MEESLSQLQWVTFLLGEEIFACRVGEVQAIIPYEEPVPVPGAPYNVEGILNVRGEIVPVLSGAKLLETSGKDSERIIIFEMPQGLVGMTVDNVGEIVWVEDAKIDTQSGTSETIKGTFLHRGQLLVLVEIPDFESVSG